MADRAMRKYHVGRISNGVEGDGASRFFSDATRELDDKAFFAKVKDVVEGSMSEAGFQEALEIIKTGQQRKIEGGVQETVDNTAKEINLSGGEADGLLKHLERYIQLSKIKMEQLNKHVYFDLEPEASTMRGRGEEDQADEDGSETRSEDERDDPLPQVFFFHSGEVTPVTLSMLSNDDLDRFQRWQISALGQVSDPDNADQEDNEGSVFEEAR